MSQQTAAPSRVTRLLIEAMAKHLPPSAAGLRLVDVDGKTGAVLLTQRPDLDVTASPAPDLAALPAGAFDAVAAFDTPLDDAFLDAAVRLLRPGGRLITIDSERDPDEGAVKTLETSGYTRILVEVGAECPLPIGTLARGEKPHETDDTLERVRVASGGEQSSTLANFRGRYLHLLVQQTPNLPTWKLTPDTPITWRAAVVDDALLAFSSLPSAVAFMQEAVLSSAIRDVNKVVKFSHDVALTWDRAVWLNPVLTDLRDRDVSYVTIDPTTAEKPDE